VLTGESGEILLDMEIDPDGRRIDYLKLDAFWGCCPRPFTDDGLSQDSPGK